MGARVKHFNNMMVQGLIQIEAAKKSCNHPHEYEEQYQGFEG